MFRARNAEPVLTPTKIQKWILDEYFRKRTNNITVKYI